MTFLCYDENTRKGIRRKHRLQSENIEEAIFLQSLYRSVSEKSPLQLEGQSDGETITITFEFKDQLNIKLNEGMPEKMKLY